MAHICLKCGSYVKSYMKQPRLPFSLVKGMLSITYSSKYRLTRTMLVAHITLKARKVPKQSMRTLSESAMRTYYLAVWVGTIPRGSNPSCHPICSKWHHGLPRYRHFLMLT